MITFNNNIINSEYLSLYGEKLNINVSLSKFVKKFHNKLKRRPNIWCR